MSEPEATKQIERKLPVNVGVPLNGLDEAYRLSQNLALAAILPDSLRGKPADVLAIVLYGQELGLAPMQSIQSIYVVRGKPQLSSDLWTALARRAGHKVRWGECNDTSATVTIVRGDDPDFPLTVSFTVEDAVKAELCTLTADGKVRARSQNGKPTPWETYTARMLRNRAISFCGKSQCPEVALGFGIEGDYDYVPSDDPIQASAPLHHGDVVDAEVIPEKTADELQAELEQAAAEFAAELNTGAET